MDEVETSQRKPIDADRVSAVELRDRFFQWLTEAGARAKSIPELLDGVVRFLNGEGYAIRRCNLATDTIHPQMTGLRHVWFDRPTNAGAVEAD